MPNADPPAPRPPRVIALAVVILHDHLLAAPVHEPGRSLAYRPLGGAVEFGERAADAAVRELREETGRDAELLDLISVSENLFEYAGAPGHEIVFAYHVRFVPGAELGDLSPLPCADRAPGGPDERFDAVWLPLAEVLAGSVTVYPAGFADDLARWLNRR